jgi:hypothetical protein
MKYVLGILAMTGLLAHMGQWTPGQHNNQPVQTVVDLEIPK